MFWESRLEGPVLVSPTPEARCSMSGGVCNSMLEVSKECLDILGDGLRALWKNRGSDVRAWKTFTEAVLNG